MSDSVTPWTAAHQASLSITDSWSLLKLMSIKLVMPSNHLILCHSFLLPSVFPSSGIFSSESLLHIRWPKYWSFSFSIQSFSEYSGLISFTKTFQDSRVIFHERAGFGNVSEGTGSLLASAQLLPFHSN